jgi:hypothetical protein
VTVRGVVDVTLQTDARFLEHRPPRIDALLLAAVALVLDEIRVEISSERIEDARADDRLERVVVGLGWSLKAVLDRHQHHLHERGANPRSVRLLVAAEVANDFSFATVKSEMGTEGFEPPID